MEEKIMGVINEVEEYGGVQKAIEEGYIQMQVAQSALKRKLGKDSGDTVSVGENYFRNKDEKLDYGELFEMDPQVADKVLEKLQKVRDNRNNAEVEKALAGLVKAAESDTENVMPHLVECCHAYATVGEMVAALKSCWGEFEEPIRL